MRRSQVPFSARRRPGGDQAAEAAPGGAVAGERGRGEAVPQDDAGGGDQARGGADGSGRRGAVGDGLEPGDRVLPALGAARVVVEGALRDSSLRGGRADGAHRLGLGPELHLPRDLPRVGVGADDAGDRVLVGDGDGGQAEKRRTFHVLLGVGAPGEEGEVRGDVEFGEHGRGSIFTFCSRWES